MHKKDNLQLTLFPVEPLGNKKTTFQLNKIIRDKLLIQTIDLGVEVLSKQLIGKDLAVHLSKKMQEELEELLCTNTNQIEELIDIQEIVNAFSYKLGFKKQDSSPVHEEYGFLLIEELLQILQGKIHLIHVHVENLIGEDKEHENIPILLLQIQEIINLLVSKYGISKSAFQKKVAIKKKEKGGFKKGIYVEQENVPATSWLFDYYKKCPEKYPIIDGKEEA